MAYVYDFFIANVNASKRHIELKEDYGSLEIGQRLKKSFMKAMFI